METVGIRELKAHLSRHLARVRAGGRLLVTDRGRVVATIDPVQTSSDRLEWARALVAAGKARWAGGKPVGCRTAVTASDGSLVSAAVLEDRR